MSERDIAEEITADIAEEITALLRERGVLAIQPRFRYWETPDGWQFHYSTERMGDGRFASAQYMPVGKGARSGKATELRVRRELHHATRRGAKARAYKLYQQHLKELEARSRG